MENRGNKDESQYELVERVASRNFDTSEVDTLESALGRDLLASFI